MNKQKYLRKLRKALKGVPEREKDNLVEYYSELIDDSLERGKSPREVFSELETPEEIAYNFRRENDFSDYGRRSARRDSAYGAPPPPYGDPVYNVPPAYGPAYSQVPPPPPPPQYRPSRRERFREKRRGHSALFWILLSPFLFIFGVLAFALGLTLTVVGLALLVALIAVIAAFTVGGLYAIVMSFHMFTVNASIALTQVGAGLALIALGNVLCLLVGPACKGYGAFLGWIFRGFRRSYRVKPVRYRSYAGKIATVATGLAVLVIGGVMGVVGFSRLGYDYKNLAVFDDYTEHTQVYDAKDTDKISVACGSMSLTVVPAAGDEFKLVWFESEREPKRVACEDGVLSVFDAEDYNQGGAAYFKNVWERGIAYSSLAHLYNRATLEVPAVFKGEIEVSIQNGYVSLSGIEGGAAKLVTSNSKIEVSDCEFTQLTAETKNGAMMFSHLAVQSAAIENTNGYVELSGIACEGVLWAKTSNGMIKAVSATAQAIELATSNGAIEVQNVQSAHIALQTSNGAIYGNIKGKKSEYTVKVSTSFGSCNLTPQEGGEKFLSAHTSNGAININFSED